jgi:hypothetical protein
MALQLYQATTSNNGAFLSSYPASNLPNTTGAVTMCCWINSLDWTTGTKSIIGMYDGILSTANTAIQIGSRTGTTGVVVWTWGGAILITSGANAALQPNVWVHVTYTCTAISGGQQTHRIYLNGLLVNTVTNSVQVAGVLTQTFVNGYPQPFASYSLETSTTQVDDLYVYNRILSDDEILTVYNTRGLRDGIVTGLVARYKFNEGLVDGIVANNTHTGLSNYDVSENLNPLYLYNANNGQAPTNIIDFADQYTRPPL